MGYWVVVPEIIGIHADRSLPSGRADLFQTPFLGDCCDVPIDLDAMHPSRRWEWIQARVMLFDLLQEREIDARLVMNPEYGYPEIVDKTTGHRHSVFASWSHTQDFVVVAIADKAIGVDVEAWDRPVGKTIARIAHAEEVETFTRELQLRAPEFPAPLALWCAKEAIAKAGGLGLRAGLKNFSLTPDPDGRWSVAMRRQGPRPLVDPVVSFIRRERFLVAVCTERAEPFEAAYRVGA